MKKTMYLFFSLLLAAFLSNVQAQGLYKNPENETLNNKASNSNEKAYSPSILRGEPDTPPGPGPNEAPVSEGMFILVGMAVLAGTRCVLKREVKIKN